MPKILSLVAFFFTAQNALALPATCRSDDGRMEVSVETVTSDASNGLLGKGIRTTLKIDGAEMPLVTPSCVLTPSIRRVIRCPHQLAAGVRAEVYPKFLKDRHNLPNLDAFENEVSIVISGEPTLKLKDCR